jgi:hypothetical protein
MIRVVHPGSGFFTHPGSRGQNGTGSRIRIPNADGRAKLNSGTFCKPNGGQFKFNVLQDKVYY